MARMALWFEYKVCIECLVPAGGARVGRSENLGGKWGWVSASSLLSGKEHLSPHTPGALMLCPSTWGGGGVSRYSILGI